ncbi:MAG: hypothetical protein Unbinned200contig1000_41 [Prokaryotic dsDNA virus sp.]|jgi:hypothetical protein|nr:MAG: hypothetical protein Unbinned200contig1000_41 [Prokaryotic dsDNA virus sp.]|tara:strand:+ start:49088 stop:50371 length:1284 start_codon:yes stop_codon:yes gene_type:complete
MKIAVALHSCMDLGGIINHTEQLIGGFLDLGHEAHLYELVYADNAQAQERSGNFERGPSGIPFAQGKGWNFPKHARLSYKTSAGLANAKHILNHYDIVIWTVPVPPKNRQHLGNDKWPELYDLEPRVKQVAFIHDGNAKSNALHLYHVAEHLSGLACVHECALNSAVIFPIPRALVVNPQFNPIREFTSWEDKYSGFVNMQTFKAWKHVHELVRSIAYMPPRMPGELREIAGKGIEYQYMTSEEKCKPAYFHDDPEKPFHTRRIWEVALENGMTHHDYWPTQDVDEWLQMARVLVDPSWSKKYSKIGGHWNRVAVDAMIRGAIPVAHKRGMGTTLFKPDEHYVPLDDALDAQDYADIILETSHMSAMQARNFQDAARDILIQFDRKAVANRVINLANGDVQTETGAVDPNLYEKFDDLMFNHYGILV